MNRDVIVALDFPAREETLAFLDLFTEEKPFVKIGMELFYGAGPEIVREIKRRGHKIFLDLKLHDIPNTVKKAMSVLSGLDVDLTNLHAGGTVAMMPADRGDAAHQHESGGDGARPLDPKAHRRSSHALCGKREKGGAGRRRLFPAGSGKGAFPLRRVIFDGHPRRALCGRRKGRPGAGHHAR